MTGDVFDAPSFVHQHNWTWQWFGLVKHLYRPEADPQPLGLRTCSCGEFQKVEPTMGRTPLQQEILDDQNAKASAKRAKMREYNHRKKMESSVA